MSSVSVDCPYCGHADQVPVPKGCRSKVDKVRKGEPTHGDIKDHAVSRKCRECGESFGIWFRY
ncbi:hypothetical protein SAMN04488066_11421 [Halorubrum aquaticum]|uniref:Uncharacterized protein n=1 Tax=Halorubrum aquaticum TaxID=387340 RepID=A0A1I3BNP6_9EURY|nr:hypothetical protein [Halorubrum aquaticum]SFH63877.1 hypothetical protein SAMN04488066_11421 [Halorubrum aquaticum]